MPTPAARTEISAQDRKRTLWTSWRLNAVAKTFSVWGLLTLPLHAQPTESPASQPADAQPQQATPPIATAPVSVKDSTGTVDSSTKSAIEGIYDKKPQDGSAAEKADFVAERMKDKATASDVFMLGPLGDETAKAQFEKFLGTSPVPEDRLKDYADTVSRIEDLLRDRKTFDAWKQLFVLAEYPQIDAGVSRELANRIESVWNAGDTKSRIAQSNAQLREEVKRSSRNADIMSDSIRQKEWENARQMRAATSNRTREQRNNGGVPQINQTGMQADGPATPPDPSTLMGKLALTDEYLQSLEARAKIKVNELKAEKLLDQVKKEFSDYVGTLYEDGFYTHVVLAADFYRRLFQEGDYPVEMAKQVNGALERSREVISTVDVFDYKMEREELAAATDRLAEGFLTSSYHPALLRISREQKQKIASYVEQIDGMRNLVEARDYTGLEELAKKVKESAKDFDVAKPLALVRAAKLEGQLRLGKAKMLAQQGDMAKAMEEFEAAAKAWPSNPDLEDKAGVFFNQQDLKTQSLEEFDRLVVEENYRGIFDKQVAFAPAIQGDKEREEAFADALARIKNAEVATEKANTLLMNGDIAGAWEAVELAAQALPDDQKLNKLRADLSGKSAEFVASINKARQAEEKKDFGYSLTWYVNAQRQYPPSQIANEGVKRLSEQILASNPASL